MPSLVWKVVTGLLMVFVFGYTVAIASRPLIGVIAATLGFLVAWLVAYAGQSTVLPTLGRKRTVVATVISVLVIGYSLLIAGEILLGVLATVLIFGVAFVHAALKQHGYPIALGRSRTIVVSVLSVLVMAYAILVVAQFLLGLFAVGLLVLTAWLTSPTGPLLQGS